MWSVVIVVVAPWRNHAAGMAHKREQVFVQAPLAHASSEAFDKAIVHGLPGRDVMPVDLAIFLPVEHRVAGQFCSVVGDYHTGIAAHLGDTIQLSGHMPTANGYIHDSC